jgi:hypothetical protein
MLILDGVPADYGKALAEQIQPAIAAAGWRSGDEPPSVWGVSLNIAAFNLLNIPPGDGDTLCA